MAGWDGLSEEGQGPGEGQQESHASTGLGESLSEAPVTIWLAPELLRTPSLGAAP